ncbi:hypothetical protein OF83DRAFT_340047 [Amylostereum chailletii]|nr:hypothetical protein OF83DRAFT_340047 [Amylostereum chailletii]
MMTPPPRLKRAFLRLAERITSLSQRVRPSFQVATSVAVCGLDLLSPLADAFPPAKGVVTLIIHFVTLAQQMGANDEQIEEIGQEITSIYGTIHRAVEHDGNMQSIPADALQTLENAMQAICDDMTSIYKQPSLKSLFFAKRNNDQITTFDNRLHRAVAAFEHAMLFSIANTTTNMDAKLDALYEMVAGIRERFSPQ